MDKQTSIWAVTWQNQQSECVPSEDSDQPGHSSLSAWRKLGSLATYLVQSEGSDQTGQIWVVAGPTLTLLVLTGRGSFDNSESWDAYIMPSRHKHSKPV